MKKHLLAILISIVFLLPTQFLFAQGITAESLLKVIEELKQQVLALQKQVTELRSELGETPVDTTSVSSTPASSLSTSSSQSGAVTETPETSPVLPEFERTLHLGAAGDDVRKLQTFLKQFPDIYPQGLITGYFGPLTRRAVEKFQEKHGIVSGGVSEVTGYGTLGPQTRTKLNELLTEGAGRSGVIPPGLLTAPGIQIQQGTTTQSSATTTATTTIPAVPATPAIPATPAQPSPGSDGGVVPATPATPAIPAQPATTITTSSASYGSALSLSGVSDLLGKIWGPGSNGIVVGGGLNYSTQVGVGWSQQYGGMFVTSYSIQGVGTNYLTQTNSTNVVVSGPSGSVIEVWDLESLTVVATNSASPGSSVTFTAQPNRRYGGFAWYADNSQKNIEIRAVYSSSTQSDSSSPSIPTGLSATAISSTQIDFTWSASTDNVGVVGYKVYRNGSFITSVTGIAYSNTGLTSATTYSYTVAAYDAAGNVSAQSSSVSATTLSATTSASSTLKLTYPNGGESLYKGSTYRFFWNNPLASGFAGQENFYWIVALERGGSTTWGADGSAPVTQSYFDWTIPNLSSTHYAYLPEGSDYKARVLLGRNCGLAPTKPCPEASTILTTGSPTDDYSDSNVSILAAIQSTSTSTSDTTPPSTPTNLSATAISSTQINLSWNASTDNVGVTGYYIYRNGSQNTLASIVSGLTYNDTGLLSGNVSGLSPGTTYTYTVSAYDAAGNVSAQSSSVSATTQVDFAVTSVSVSPSSAVAGSSVTVSATFYNPSSIGQSIQVTIGKGVSSTNDGTAMSTTYYLSLPSGNTTQTQTFTASYGAISSAPGSPANTYYPEASISGVGNGPIYINPYDPNTANNYLRATTAYTVTTLAATSTSAMFVQSNLASVLDSLKNILERLLRAF